MGAGRLLDAAPISRSERDGEGEAGYGNGPESTTGWIQV